MKNCNLTEFHCIYVSTEKSKHLTWVLSLISVSICKRKKIRYRRAAGNATTFSPGAMSRSARTGRSTTVRRDATQRHRGAEEETATGDVPQRTRSRLANYGGVGIRLGRPIIIISAFYVRIAARAAAVAIPVELRSGKKKK